MSKQSVMTMQSNLRVCRLSTFFTTLSFWPNSDITASQGAIAQDCLGTMIFHYTWSLSLHTLCQQPSSNIDKRTCCQGREHLASSKCVSDVWTNQMEHYNTALRGSECSLWYFVVYTWIMEGKNDY